MIFQQHAKLFLALILGFSFFLSVSAMKDDSLTFDERVHIPAAYTYVRYGDMRLNPEHPPLLKDLSGLPLLFADFNFPTQSDLWTNGITKKWQFGTTMWSAWDLGTEFIFRSGNNADSILFWSRFPMIILGLLLGLCIYFATKELAGTAAGLFATLIFALDPNILAHNHLVTTDLGIAAFIFFAVFAFAKFLKNPSTFNILFAGTVLGLAELTKFSAVLLFPLFGLFALLAGITFQSSDADNQKTFRLAIVGKFIGKTIAIFLLAFGIIYIGYAVNTRNMPKEITLQHADLVFSGDQSAKVFARNAIHTVANLPGGKPLAHYSLGIFMVFSRVAGGNSFYFLNAMPDHASHWYFPVLFFTKETGPVLLLSFFAIFYAIAKQIRFSTNNASSPRKSFALWFQQNTFVILMTSFVALYVALSVSGNLNIGLRHIFPILPFVYVLITVSAFRFVAHQSTSCTSRIYCANRHFYSIILGVIAFWSVSVAAWAHPNYLSYYNEFVGTANGYRIAVDSNYDWGQNLKRLKTWINTYNACIQPSDNDAVFVTASDCRKLTESKSFPTRNRIETIHLDYYGGSDINYYFSPESYRKWNASDTPQAGWFAISATFFQESTHRSTPENTFDYRWLSQFKPVGRAGSSIFIFYISEEDLQSISR